MPNVGAIVALVLVIAFMVWVARRVGLRFLVTRTAGLLFVLLGVTFITFILGYFAPGDVVTAQLGTHYSAQAAATLRHFYGLDQPWYVQYGQFLNRLVHFSFGYSWLQRSVTVGSILATYVPVSAELGISATILSVLIGVPLGVFVAVHAGSRADSGAQTIALIFFALPTFVVIPFFEILMIYLYQHGLPNLPVSSTDWKTQPIEWVAPIVIFALVGFAFWVRLTRTSMLDVLRQDFVRTARAKGLRERVVIFRHAFRNALIPLVTVIGPALAFTVNGAFIIEDLFNIPGIGSQTISSITNRDYPVVQGTVIILAVAIAVFNLITDIVYGLLDPRIKVA